MSFLTHLQTISQDSAKTLSTKKGMSRVRREASSDYDIDDIVVDELPLEFVKQYLRVDHEFDDLEISVALKSATAYVKKYIKHDGVSPLDFDLIMPILTLTAHYYENKSATAKATEKIDSIINSILDMNREDIV